MFGEEEKETEDSFSLNCTNVRRNRSSKLLKLDSDTEEDDDDFIIVHRAATRRSMRKRNILQTTTSDTETECDSLTINDYLVTCHLPPHSIRDSSVLVGKTPCSSSLSLNHGTVSREENGLSSQHHVTNSPSMAHESDSDDYMIAQFTSDDGDDDEEVNFRPITASKITTRNSIHRLSRHPQVCMSVYVCMYVY